ncbi:MAG: 4Fe-4S single cluster domain-containing protein [Pseudanabaenaceae cyanobacterium SKYGB_i_bin29]|nr:radical SAM protein [Pseudanabaenaceae cyanobacterium SKYG29]MDW8421347.1 4Fe-4S single cluster domain-containing protein [Pseudanabaenaceae cyanobacterium SKYGB_i_bin29]
MKQPPVQDFIPPGHLNIMGLIHESAVNGPGRRAVVWVQGCQQACLGCFNPQSWEFVPNQIVPAPDLAAQILANPHNEGVTFSGGEPFWQAEALTELAKLLRAEGLSVMSFTGFTLEELRSPQAPPYSQALLDQLDILIDGPYVQSLAVNSPDSLVSSRNQRVHVFNPAFADRLDWASDQAEIHILKDGTRIITGFLGSLNLSAN